MIGHSETLLTEHILEMEEVKKQGIICTCSNLTLLVVQIETQKKELH